MDTTRVAVAGAAAAALLLVSPAASGAVEIHLDTAGSPLVYGDRVAFHVETAAGAPVVVHADEFPYDGVEREVARGAADADGDFDVRDIGRRNTRYRAVREDTGESVTREVTVDLDKEVLPAGRNRLRLSVVGPPDSVGGLRLELRRGPPVGGGSVVIRRVRLRRVNRTIALAFFRSPPSTLFCLVERRDNGHGPPPDARGDCDMSPRDP